MAVTRRLVMAAAAIVALGASAAVGYQFAKPGAPDVPRIAIGGPIDLVSTDGKRFTDAEIGGKPFAVFFGFTHCPNVCPTTLSDLTLDLGELGPLGDRLKVLFVTVDPERDTPAVLKAWLQTRYPRFLGLTGSREAIEAIRSAYKVFASRKADPDDPDGYAMAHTAFSYLLDANGHYVAHFTDTVDEQRVAASISTLIGR